MPNLKISQLPYVSNTAYTNNDLFVFVNYGGVSGKTSNTTLLQHKEWVLSGFVNYFLKNQVNSATTITIKQHESIFNPCDLNLLDNSIFIVEQNACYYVLGDLSGDGSLIVDGTLKIGGALTTTGPVTGTGVIL